MRPAILNDKGQLVKFFTLKKAADPTNVLSDISTLTIQASLQKISSQIEDIGRDIKSMIDFARREELSIKFINARDKIILAAGSSGTERDEYLKAADTYLMEGLNSLYADINDQVKKLAQQKGPFASLKAIDSILKYINEDMQMIPRYVGMRAYLFNYRKDHANANRILEEYRHQLQVLSERKIENGEYTAVELIHKNYPYDKENVDFWLSKPKQMVKAINSYETMLEQKENEIYYIDVEDEENE